MLLIPSSDNNMLCINGMSNYNRDSGNANSAIIVTVNSDDYGKELFDGVRFQEMLERNAYNVGKGYIPISLYKDYKNNCISKSFGNPFLNSSSSSVELHPFLPSLTIRARVRLSGARTRS